MTARRVNRNGSASSEVIPRQLLRFLMDTSTEAMLQVGSSGFLLDANPCALDLLGYEREELMGLPISSFLLTENGTPHFDLFRPAAQ